MDGSGFGAIGKRSTRCASFKSKPEFASNRPACSDPVAATSNFFNLLRHSKPTIDEIAHNSRVEQVRLI